MPFYASTVSYTDTNEHPESFVDQISGESFTPSHIMVISKSSNSNDLTFKLMKSRSGVTLTKGQSIVMDDINLHYGIGMRKGITRYWLSFLTANDSVQIIAW